ncbi:MAG: BlaI/MecI/CopY family transcriptional regulator [Clostridia bacterium]|jgi:Predicted transcriptional regulator|nr:BlaI/MecI/CopY family transcriptional regulator [Clostridia bacterium]
MEQQMELGEVQERFAKLVWANAPIPSGELVKLCEKELNWKKPTTYTVLRKLCERGLFENDNGVVKTRISREAFYAARSEQFVDSTFNGSLPAFLTAFTARKGLSDEEADEIVRMIEAYRKENRK